MGYGFGVWYLVRNKYIDNFIRTNNQTSHIAHITVMCHMDKKEAIKLYDYLKYQIYKEELFIPITNLKLFNGSYTDKEKDIAYGIEFSAKKWYLLKEDIINKFKGCFPITPHLSLIYRKNKNKIELVDETLLENVNYLLCDLVVADITSDNPWEWKIL